MNEAIMSGLALVVQVADLLLFVLLIVAILRIFTICALLQKILQKITELGALGVECDRHRREEFEALTQEQG